MRLRPVRFSVFFSALLLSASLAQAQVPCGGSFSGFVSKMKAEALSRGYAKGDVDRFFGAARQDPRNTGSTRAVSTPRNTTQSFPPSSVISAFRAAFFWLSGRSKPISAPDKAISTRSVR